MGPRFLRFWDLYKAGVLRRSYWYQIFPAIQPLLSISNRFARLYACPGLSGSGFTAKFSSVISFRQGCRVFTTTLTGIRLTHSLLNNHQEITVIGKHFNIRDAVVVFLRAVNFLINIILSAWPVINYQVSFIPFLPGLTAHGPLQRRFS